MWAVSPLHSRVALNTGLMGLPRSTAEQEMGTVVLSAKPTLLTIEGTEMFFTSFLPEG